MSNIVSVKTLSRYIANAFLSKFSTMEQMPISSVAQLYEKYLPSECSIYISTVDRHVDSNDGADSDDSNDSANDNESEFNYAVYSECEISYINTNNILYTVIVTNDDHFDFIKKYLELIDYTTDDTFDVIFSRLTVPILDDYEKYYNDLELSLEKIGELTHMFVVFGK